MYIDFMQGLSFYLLTTNKKNSAPSSGKKYHDIFITIFVVFLNKKFVHFLCFETCFKFSFSSKFVQFPNKYKNNFCSFFRNNCGSFHSTIYTDYYWGFRWQLYFLELMLEVKIAKTYRRVALKKIKIWIVLFHKCCR